MSERDSPIGEHANEPVNDGQEQEYEDAVAAADSDRDSDALSEVDEDQFEDYDPETANIEDRPVDIDEDVARTLKATKRKRADGEAPKKPREGRRDKKRRDRDEDVDMDDAEDGGKKSRRSRRAAGDGERRQRSKPASPEPEKEENLTPAERKQRELDRMIDAAIKKPSGLKRRKKDEIDLEDEIDDLLADLKVQMEQACQADNQAREAGQPALHKLKLLPEVTAILNRNNVQHAVLDPDTNFLQHVKFFLEPLNDGSLPAYNIQRDIFNALAKMNIDSGGVLYSRPILKRTDDYKKRQIETRDYDYESAKMAQRQKTSSQFSLSQRPAVNAKDAERERLLAPSRGNNSARMVNLPSSYTVAPQSTFMGSQNSSHRPLGAGGMEAFRKMAQKSKKRAN
ncbi:Transcription factor IWS1 [Fusarium oxysporum f. sp. cubense race 1]|uniref:Transcription factor IWS1 n=1 Tax=Fusarium oxysporum f. sp. cubense (strain race 1) TaxID=1229664 RepID=N4UNK5_FUSC1|nr:Transcription factor IWS1 [Fusarium oxysporum f. sp. cubense race 1]